MNIEMMREESKLQTKMMLTIKDSDLHSLGDPNALVPMVQSKLAVAIVDRIMERVGPELDRILGDKK